jgi:hypothetical protein
MADGSVSASKSYLKVSFIRKTYIVSKNFIDMPNVAALSRAILILL